MILLRCRQSSMPEFTACQTNGVMVWAESPIKTALSMQCQASHLTVPKYPTGFSVNCTAKLGILSTSSEQNLSQKAYTFSQVSMLAKECQPYDGSTIVREKLPLGLAWAIIMCCPRGQTCTQFGSQAYPLKLQLQAGRKSSLYSASSQSTLDWICFLSKMRSLTFEPAPSAPYKYLALTLTSASSSQRLSLKRYQPASRSPSTRECWQYTGMLLLSMMLSKISLSLFLAIQQLMSCQPMPQCNLVQCPSSWWMAWPLIGMVHLRISSRIPSYQKESRAFLLKTRLMDLPPGISYCRKSQQLQKMATEADFLLRYRAQSAPTNPAPHTTCSKYVYLAPYISILILILIISRPWANLNAPKNLCA